MLRAHKLSWQRQMAKARGRKEGEPRLGKILVVDDEEAIIIYLTLLLEDQGYEICTAMDGDQGLEAARRERPDVVCMDIMMPRRSGLALYADMCIDSELCSIPVIFISGFNDLMDLRRIETFRKTVPDRRVPLPEYCFEKPVDVPEFLQAIETLMVRKARGPGEADGDAHAPR